MLQRQQSFEVSNCFYSRALTDKDRLLVSFEEFAESISLIGHNKQIPNTTGHYQTPYHVPN
jgi:hypothetical protein